MVLALEAHRRHVGTGVGGRLMAPDDPGPPAACRRGRGQRQGQDRKTGRCGQLGHQVGWGSSWGERSETEVAREAQRGTGSEWATGSPGRALESAGRKSAPQGPGRARSRPWRGVLPRSPLWPRRPVSPGVRSCTVGARMGLPAVFPGWVWGSLGAPGEFLGGAPGVLTWGPRGQHQGSGHNQ